LKIGVIFDLDGTLLNSLEDLYNAVNDILRQYGLPERSLEEIRRFVGNGAKTLVQRALPGREDDPPLDEIYPVYQDHYNKVCKQGTACPYPGILDALAEIRKKYPIAVVSNKPDLATKELCREYFGDIYALGVSPELPKKPAPDMVYAAMKELGVEKCVYVGDSETDAETAANAGAPCLSVLWGFRDREEIAAVGGKHFCTDAKDMLPMIEQIIETELTGQ